MSTHSVVFCGTPDFAVPSLRALATDPAFDVQLVITQPDRPAGRGKTLTKPAVKIAAEELGLSVWQPDSLNRERESIPLSTPPDFLVVVAYGQLLSQELLDWPSVAPINVHASLLPRWRGASPIEHAILSGDTQTGIAIQRMVKELDAGPVLGSASYELSATSTAPMVRDALSTLGAELLVQTLKAPLQETPQPTEGITICRKLSRLDGDVDHTTMTAEEIDRRVRAFTPWPGVKLTIEGNTIKVLASALEATGTSAPLLCKDNTTLHLVSVQEAGKKPVTGVEWMRGH